MNWKWEKWRDGMAKLGYRYQWRMNWKLTSSLLLLGSIRRVSMKNELKVERQLSNTDHYLIGINEEWIERKRLEILEERMRYLYQWRMNWKIPTSCCASSNILSVSMKNELKASSPISLNEVIPAGINEEWIESAPNLRAAASRDKGVSMKNELKVRYSFLTSSAIFFKYQWRMNWKMNIFGCSVSTVNLYQWRMNWKTIRCGPLTRNGTSVSMKNELKEVVQYFIITLKRHVSMKNELKAIVTLIFLNFFSSGINEEWIESRST